MMDDFWGDIKFNFWYYTKKPFTFFRGIRRWLVASFQYSRFLWDNHYDWDWIYLLTLLQFKLSRMRENTLEGYHLGKEKTAKKMRTCELLIERIVHDDYCKMEYEEHENKWGKLKMFSEQRTKNGSVEVLIMRDKARNDLSREKEWAEHKKIIEKADKLKKQEINYLFKTISKNLLYWWS
jgi:hypothetical protein